MEANIMLHLPKVSNPKYLLQGISFQCYLTKYSNARHFPLLKQINAHAHHPLHPAVPDPT